MTAVMGMMPAFVIVVVGAAVGFVDKPAVEVGGGQFFDGRSDLAGADGDALLREKIQRPPADAAGNHHAGALLAQPARKKSGRVLRRSHRAQVENLVLSGVRLNERELPASAEMFVQPAIG